MISTGSADGDSRSDNSITRYLKCEVPHPAANHKYAPEEGKTMNENNRVLSRQNARELTPAE
ncbi:MAG TPA: hypothetical protein VHV32_09020, partial [Candidatus Angelobacter sp.]|nr:hypothetical protein [Candidatus Angelobacter sp.]